tara:strand:- start:5861 stop:6517 length:657 start_codon:yes stop_codon:yes gene_type:complete
MKDELVVLVHGFFKNRSDMNFLEEGLRDLGYDTLTVDLPTTFGSLDDCVKSMHIQVNQVTNRRTVHYVAHSMGGLITRTYLNEYGSNIVSRCVFVATPNYGSELAAIADYIPFYSNIFKPIKALMPKEPICNRVHVKAMELGVIAGNVTKGPFGRVFLKPPNDGHVTVESAIPLDAKDSIILPYSHKKIHHAKETLEQIIFFIKNGRFRQDVTATPLA